MTRGKYHPSSARGITLFAVFIPPRNASAGNYVREGRGGEGFYYFHKILIFMKTCQSYISESAKVKIVKLDI